MKTIVLAALGVALPAMALAQSPTFEVQGFPLSMHQAQVIAFADAHEQAATAMPAVRRIEAGESVSGSEPDPESFDQAGLETWWLHYREAQAMWSTTPVDDHAAEEVASVDRVRGEN